MVFYIALAVFPLVVQLYFRNIYVDKEQKRNFLIIVGIFLFLFLALRSRYIGSTDTYNYYNMMIRAINSEKWDLYYNENGVEKGFQLFTFLLSRVFRNPQWIIVVSSALYVVSICYFIYHNSADAPLSMVLYITIGLMVFEMQGMRQAMAMSICLFAYEAIKRKRLIIYVLLVLLAMQFHRTALVFFIIYPLTKLKYDYKGISIVCLGALFSVVFSELIVNVANDVFESKYNRTVNAGGFVATAIYILILIFTVFFNRELKHSGNNKDLFYTLIVATCCYILRYFGAQAAERISFYFMFSQIALLPNSMKRMREVEKAPIRTTIIILAIFLFIYRLSDSDLIPYYFYWKWD